MQNQEFLYKATKEEMNEYHDGAYAKSSDAYSQLYDFAAKCYKAGADSKDSEKQKLIDLIKQLLPLAKDSLVHPELDSTILDATAIIAEVQQ